MHVSEVVSSLRYATVEQVAKILGDTSFKYQNTARKLRRLNISFKHGTRSVHSYLTQPKFADHELLITDVHILLWDSLLFWQQEGLKSDINPDAFYRTAQGNFYLEVERSNPRSEDGQSAWLKKAWNYLDHQGQFRVHFDVRSEAKAKNLCEAIKKSGIRHLGKFWISWGGEAAISPNGRTYRLPCGRPTLPIPLL